jgi:uncharacterized protein YcbK (DUF882 family)
MAFSVATGRPQSELIMAARAAPTGELHQTGSRYLPARARHARTLQDRPVRRIIGDNALRKDRTMNQRRSFLKSSVVLASALSLPALSKAAKAANEQPAERTLRLYNTHTGESLKSVFWAEGQFQPEALQDINRLLRDHRNNQIKQMDPQLLVLLDKVASQFGDQHVLHVISGYRSPETNAMLHEHTSGVAKHSLHIEGKAIDVRLPGTDLASLHKAAVSARGGGVGYYPASDFVHMDTGRVRYW